MSANPYASPRAASENLPEPAREIRVVVRVFRLVGWVGVVLYLPMTLGTAGALAYSRLAETVESPLVLAGALLINGSVLFVSITFLRTAKGLTQKHH